jgi:hypothetical protein
MRPRGFTEATLVVLAATALTIALTFPVAFRIDRIGRVDTDDGRWSIWVVSWVAHALTSQPRALYDANIFYPHRYALAFSEANLGAGIVGAPVWAATHNPYTTHNVVFLASFVFAFLGAYALARYLTGSRIAATVAGILFAFCPYIYARTAHIQLLLTAGMPFALLAFHRLADQPSISRAVVLGVILCATSLSCAYYGIFAGLMVGLGTLIVAYGRGVWRSRSYWTGIILAAFVSVALTLPFFVPYLYVQKEMGFARTLDDARQYSVNASAWAASSAWAHRWWLPWLDEPNEVLFPGIVATVLGALGVVWLIQKRSWELVTLYGLIAVFAFWASFGPDAGLYRVFYETLPIFSFLRAPGRMGVMTTLALTVFAAMAVAAIVARAKSPRLIGSLLALVAVADLARVPLGQFRDADPLPPVYRLLATLPHGAVAEFPYWYQRSDFPRHAYYMLNSTAHWKPLVNGYSDHIPQDFRQSVLPLASFPAGEAFSILGRANARYVLFHLNMYDTRSRAKLFERLATYAEYLRPLHREGDVWLYEIIAWPN